MSYDIYLKDPVSGECVEISEPHFMRGRTYAIGGSTRLELNVTYNYAPHFRLVGDNGMRSIYGKTGLEAIPMLQRAADALSDDVDSDYWKPTEGNAKRALIQLITMAQMWPDAIFEGD